jgi:hypothetical protein
MCKKHSLRVEFLSLPEKIWLVDLSDDVAKTIRRLEEVMTRLAPRA